MPNDGVRSSWNGHSPLKRPAPAGPGEARMSRPGGGSMANVADYLQGIDFQAGRQDVLSYARHQDAPGAVMDQLQRLNDQRFSNMAQVMSAIGTGERSQSSGHRLPIADYDELTVAEVKSRLAGLSAEGLQAVKSHEGEHKRRKTLLGEIDRRLK